MASELVKKKWRGRRRRSLDNMNVQKMMDNGRVRIVILRTCLDKLERSSVLRPGNDYMHLPHIFGLRLDLPKVLLLAIVTSSGVAFTPYAQLLYTWRARYTVTIVSAPNSS